MCYLDVTGELTAHTRRKISTDTLEREREREKGTGFGKIEGRGRETCDLKNWTLKTVGDS